jgi:hypothetical protein
MINGHSHVPFAEENSGGSKPLTQKAKPTPRDPPETARSAAMKEEAP